MAKLGAIFGLCLFTATAACSTQAKRDDMADLADDAAAEAVADSPKISDLEKRVTALEARDEAMFNYAKAIDRVSDARDKSTRATISQIFDQIPRQAQNNTDQPAQVVQ